MKAIALLAAGLLGSVCSAQYEIPAKDLAGTSHGERPTRLQADWVVKSLSVMEKHGLLAETDIGLTIEEPISRRNAAMFTYAAFSRLKLLVDNLQKKIDLISRGNDIEIMRDDIDSLKSEVESLRRLDKDVVALRRLTSLYRRELGELGVDVEAMSRDLEDMGSRVASHIDDRDGTGWEGPDPGKTACRKLVSVPPLKLAEPH